MILRLSQRLARKIQAGPFAEMPSADHPWDDWSCRLFVAQRTEYIIISNTASLYSCVMPGQEIVDPDGFLNRLRYTMGGFFKADQQPHAYQRLIAAASAGVTFAKFVDRSVMVSMADHVHGSKLFLSDGLPTNEIGVRLNNTPMRVLMDCAGRRYARPREVFERLANHQD